MKKLLFALGLLMALTAQAQIEVSEFYRADTDLSALELRDVDGDLYSIIKIRTESPNLNLNEIDAEVWSQMKGEKTRKVERNGRVVELWVYARYGETGIKLFYRNSTKEIKFNSLKPGTNVGKGEVYMMILRSNSDPSGPSQQWVVFDVEPKDALVRLGDDFIRVSDGTAKKFVKFGTYTYTVECRNYHTQTGSITVGENKETVSVRLKPAFGSIAVSGNEGAAVYLDNEMRGTAPLTLKEVPSGKHNVRLVKEKYKTLTRMVTVSDAETVAFDHSMEQNFATLTFSVEGGAEIWINGQKRGTGKVTDDFEAGTLTVETRKASHRNSIAQSISVVAGQSRTINLDPPTPIYGSLNVDCEPMGAKVYIDGNYIDETPVFVSRLLVGKHDVKISKDGYDDSKSNITIEEGKTVTHVAKLNKASVFKAESGKRYDLYGKAPSGQTLYYTISGKNVAVAHPGTSSTSPYSGYEKPTGDLIIPSSVTCGGITYSVTSIGDRAFSSCTGLTSVTIPNSVTSIGNEAFRNCTGLTSVTIPNSVTSIGSSAFYLVRNIVYNGTATGSPWGALTVNGYVDGYLIYSDNSKTTLTGCSTQATGEITIPNSVTSIGSFAFSGCTDRTSVTIPNSVTLIGERTFWGCTGLTSVTIPNSVTFIGSYAFFACTGLTSVTIPNSVTSIGSFAFSGCNGLTSVKIGNSVTSIGERTFLGCTGLTSVTIPNSVTSIGEDAFFGVKRIVYSGSATGWWGAEEIIRY